MNENRLSRVLRAVGALFLLISASTFLLSSWPDQSDLVRYLVLSGHVGILFLGALYCGVKLKEPKTARVLLWTSTATVPFVLAALGGLVYSQFSLDALSEKLPQIATWVAPGPGSALICVALSLPLVFAVVRSTARVLSPSLARNWTWAFMAQSLLFLVPVRASDAAAVLIGMGLAAPLLMEKMVFLKTDEARTLEGRLLRTLLWAGPGMITLRTTIFYQPSDFFVGILLMACGVLISLLVDTVTWSKGLSSTVGLVGVVMATTGAIVFATGSLPSSLGMLAALFPIALLVAMSRWTRITSKLTHIMAHGLSVLATMTLLLISPSALQALGFFVFFVALTVMNFATRRNKSMVLAGVLSCGSLVAMLGRVIGFEDVHLWHVLSCLGLVSFALAVLLEKQLPGIVRRFKSSPA